MSLKMHIHNTTVTLTPLIVQNGKLQYEPFAIETIRRALYSGKAALIADIPDHSDTGSLEDTVDEFGSIFDYGTIRPVPFRRHHMMFSATCKLNHGIKNDFFSELNDAINYVLKNLGVK